MDKEYVTPAVTKAINLLFAQKNGKILTEKEKLTVGIYEEKLRKDREAIFDNIKQGKLSVYMPIVPKNADINMVESKQASLKKQLESVMTKIALNALGEGSTVYQEESLPGDRFFSYHKHSNTWTGTSSKTKEYIHINDLK